MTEIAHGTVSEAKVGFVKVILHDYDDYETDWLKVPCKGTTKDKDGSTIPKGTQVACIVDEDDLDEGVCIGCTYNDEDTPPEISENIWHKSFEDGTVIEYDKSSHKMTVNVCAGGSLEITGDLKVNGKIEATGDIKSGSISLSKHKHQGDSGGTTGEPF